MDDIYYSLTSLMEAMKDRDKARSEYTGYSWGWAGQEYEDAVNKAKKRFEAAFDERVVNLVNEQLAKRQ